MLLEEILNWKNKRIAIDIDNTLTKENILPADYLDMNVNEYYFALNIAKPNKDIIRMVNGLYKNNFIYLYTSRPLDSFKITTNWLRDNNVKYHHIVFDKPYFDVLIDDKAVNIDGVRFIG